MIPLLAEQRVLPATVIRAIPVRLGFTVKRAIPFAPVRLERLIPGAFTRTTARANGLPFDSRTRATIVVALPTTSCRGFAFSDLPVKGGGNGPTTNVGWTAGMVGSA